MNPALTNGSVFFQDTAGISQDNANFFYDKTNHRLGLGTTTPDSTLVLRPSGGAPVLNVFSNLGTNALYVANNGNVAIGTIAAVAKLSVAGDVSFGVIDTFHYDQNNRQLRLGYDPSNYDTFTTASNGSLTVAATGTNPNITLTPGGTGYTILNGNVGIGSATPTRKLDVNGDAQFASHVVVRSGAGLFIRNPTDDAAAKLYSTASTGNVNLLFNVNGDRMIIDNSGNLGIGTTAPDRRLTVASDGSNWISGTFAGSGGTDRVVLGNLSNVASIGAHNSALSAWANLAINPGGGKVAVGYGSFGTASFAVNGNLTVGEQSAISSANIIEAYNASSNVYISANTGLVSGITGLSFNNAGTIVSAIDSDTQNKNLRFFTNGTLERMRIDINGNVGIGTTTPGANLDVQASQATTQIKSTSNTNGAWLQILQGTNTTVYLGISNSAGTAFGFTGEQANAAIFGTTAASRPVQFATAGLIRQTIDTNGNVGIGTTTPVNKLDVNGSLAVGTYAGSTTSPANSFIVSGKIGIGVSNPTQNLVLVGGSQIQISNSQGSTGLQLVGSDGSDNIIGTMGSSEDLVFRTASTERMRIKNGNLGINTTAPASKLHIHGTVPYGQARFTPSSATGESSIGFFDDVAGTDANDAWSVGQGSWGQTGKFVIGNENNGAGGSFRLVIQKDGNVGIGTGAPRTLFEVYKSTASALGPSLTLRNDGGGAGSGSSIDFSSNAAFVVPQQARIQSLDDGNFSAHLTFSTKIPGGDNALAERMRITDVGNVGIGTTAPANALDIGSTQGIHIASGTPTNTTAALYNNAGVLTWNGSAVSAGAPAFSAITGGTNTAAAMVVGTGSSLTYQGGAATSGSINANLYKGNSLVAVGDGGTGTSNGSITGTGALTYAAGGVNQNVTLTPSGTGYTLLNGNVGIGTSTPAALLTLEGSGAINGGLNAGLNIRSTNASGLSLFRFTTSDNVSFDFGKNGPSNQGGSVYFWAGSNIPIAFGNNNTARLSIDTTGGISMGTYAAAGGGSSPANGLVVSGNVGVGVSAPGAKLSVSGGAGIGSSYSGTAVSDGNMIIQGNVGVGTVTPNAKLSLWNNIATGFLDNYSEYQILLYDSATPSSSVGIGVKSNTMVFNSGSGAFSFDRGGSVTAMAIDLAGNVGIGTTGPAQKLEVSGTIRQTGCTTAGTLSANVSGDIICTPSSQNFKNNIVSIDTGLSTLLSLRPVSYNFNPDMNMGTGLHYGFISEEVATINPQFATYDGAGHPYGLDTTAILATTVNAIKELDLKIQPLTSLNVEESGSLASLIRDYLENISNGLRKVFVGEVNTKSLCVSDDTGAKTCITKSQLDALISGASGSVVNNGGGGSTPPVPDPVCTSPQTLVNGVCVDPIPETPPSDTPQAPEPTP
jgi:hypothetical protein